MKEGLGEGHLSSQLYSGYTEADTRIFSEFMDDGAKAESGFVVDFLGSRIRTSSLWKEARTLDGQRLGVPVPADFHAEAIEWIGLLKAVRSASERYVAMELGAGFGPWVIAGAVAARRRGIAEIRLCAVEGDPQRFRSLRQHFCDNDFDPNQHRLLAAAVGASAGVMQWPVGDDSSSGEDWGARPIESSKDYRGIEFRETRPIEVLPLRDLVLSEDCWDLIHLDVQGGEVEICRSCMGELSARVRRVVAATHSRKLDGDLLELLYRAGWVLEHEKPSRFAFAAEAASLEAMTTMDGAQVWRNPRLVRPGDPLASFGQEITSETRAVRIQASGKLSLDVTARNTGAQPWFGGAGPFHVNVGYRWLDSSGNILPIEGSRAAIDGRLTQPGESNRFRLEIVAPPQPGSYSLLISMVQEDVSWFFARGAQGLVLPAEVS